MGRSAPDFEFEDGTKLGEYCLDGRALLFAFVEDSGLFKLASRWPGRLNFISTKMKDKSELAALFVRPDGYVAWAADRDSGLTNAASALSMSLGNSELDT